MIFLLLILFWFCTFLVFYTYIGYGFLIYILIRIKEMFVDRSFEYKCPKDNLPEVTFFIAAYNEESFVDDKMINTLNINYPKDKLKIFWVTDGSTDATNEKLRAYENITILFEPQRRGKTAAMNRGMQFVDTPFVVFTDANSIVNVDSVMQMIRLFSDSNVGCVSGEKRISVDEEDGVSSKGESVYWKYESLLKSLDSRFYSVMGAAGELYAIRRELFEPIPEDTLLDDFILSMHIAEKGYRIAYAKEAYAVERGTLNIKEEEKRKKRITAGGWQAIFRLSGLLNIFRHGKLSFQYISHRMLRWSLTPFALFALFPLSLILYKSDVPCPMIYGVAFVFQLLFYLFSCIGYLNSQKGLKVKLFYIPYYFMFMNINVFRGLVYLWKNNGNGAWEKSKRR